MLNTKEEWHVDAVSARGSRTKRTSGFAGLVPSILHMASTLEMKSKQDPELISAGPHSLETEKIYKTMYPDITTMYTKLIKNNTFTQQKFTTHLQNKIYNTFTTKFIKFTLKII